MRRAAKTDRNHAEIVKAFRQVSMSVLDLSKVGKGCPDLLVGYRGVNILVEVKDGEKCESKQALTADQVKFHDNWSGHACVATSVDDAIRKVIQHAKEMGKL